jgi:hypothetical protein
LRLEGQQRAVLSPQHQGTVGAALRSPAHAPARIGAAATALMPRASTLAAARDVRV